MNAHLSRPKTRLAATFRPISIEGDSLPLHLQPSSPAYGQRQNLKFKRLTTNEGLSQGHVSAILKDHQGFMWFGTDEGLNKYDGYRFTAYKHDSEKATSISHNSARALVEDRAGNLWVGTDSGLDRLDREKETFIHYSPGSSATSVRNILLDSQHRIWLGTNQGLFLFNPATGIFKRFQHDEKDSHTLSHNYIYRIIEDTAGELWIATRGGLNRFNPQTQQFVSYTHQANNSQSLSVNWIKAVYKDQKGHIWVGTQGGGIALFNQQKDSFTNFLHDPNNPNSVAHNDILSFVEGNDGKLWVGTENGGISVFDYEKNTFVTYQYDVMDKTSLSNNSIHSLYKDDIGNIWVGTWLGGVNFLPRFGDKFTRYQQIPYNSNSLSNNSVLCITGDSENNIWIGTDGGGLNRFERSTQRFTPYRTDSRQKNSLSTDYVITAIEVSKGMLGLGYHRVGFDLLDIKKGLFTHLLGGKHSIDFSNTSVSAVLKDRAGNLWLGLHDNEGLCYYDVKNQHFTCYQSNPKDKNSIDGHHVFSLVEDKEGNIWVGMDNGLELLDRKHQRFIHYRNDPSNKKSLSNNTVYSLLEDLHGQIWVGTSGGLNLFNRKTQTFRTYTEKDGLANNAIYGIQEDVQGRLWFSSNKGLCRFNPVTKTCRNYDMSDGLQDNSFKRNAWYRTADGAMVYGGVNGFNIFYPDSLRDNPFIPPVRITDFQVFNKSVEIGKDSPLQKSISQTREITLSYQQSVFTLEFAALNYTLPEKNQYAYKLEGFDQDWNYVGHKRTATYTNLDARDYIFRVKASNNDGLWNQQGTSIIIHILPPWWKTWWFRAIVGFVVVGSTIGYYRIRVSTIKQQNNRLERLVLEKTKELQSANEELMVREEEIKAQNDELSSRNDKLTQRQEEIAIQRDLLTNQNEKLDGARKIIEKQNKKILRHNKTLDQQVKERTKELVAYNQQLEQFAFIAAHNLRAPVARILGLGQILDLSQDNPEEERMIVSKLILTTEELDQVVKDISTILEIRKNNVLAITEINLTEELNIIKASLVNEIADTQAIIMYDFSALNTIHTVKPYLDSILMNLLSNAIKYRAANRIPCIQIKTETYDGYVCLMVSDNGLGIDLENHQKNLFSLYKRFHSHVEGKGMGLYLVKTQVTALGGKIEVESTVNSGTTFKVFLKNNATQLIPDLYSTGAIPE